MITSNKKASEEKTEGVKEQRTEGRWRTLGSSVEASSSRSSSPSRSRSRSRASRRDVHKGKKRQQEDKEAKLREMERKKEEGRRSFLRITGMEVDSPDSQNEEEKEKDKRKNKKGGKKRKSEMERRGSDEEKRKKEEEEKKRKLKTAEETRLKQAERKKEEERKRIEAEKLKMLVDEVEGRRVLNNEGPDNAAAGTAPAVGKKATVEMVGQLATEIRSFMLSQMNVTKTVCEFVFEKLGKMEVAMNGLVCENEFMKGKLETMNEYVSKGRVNEHVRECCASNGGLTASSVPVQPTYAVIVKGKEKESSVNVRKKVMSEISKNVDVRVKAVRNVKDGVAVEMASETECKRLLNEADFESVGLEADEARRFGPKIIIYDVPNEVTDGTLLEEMYAKSLRDCVNVDVFKNSTKVLFRSGKKKSNVSNVVMEVSPRVKMKLMNERRMYMNWQSYRVNEFESVSRCFNCFDFGHRTRECKRDRSCIKCCMSGHVGKDCKAAIRCGNCARRGLPSEHLVTSSECPGYKTRLRWMRERTLQNGS